MCSTLTTEAVQSFSLEELESGALDFDFDVSRCALVLDFDVLKLRSVELRTKNQKDSDRIKHNMTYLFLLAEQLKKAQ
jgi:hypothetical protein